MTIEIPAWWFYVLLVWIALPFIVVFLFWIAAVIYDYIHRGW